MKAVTVTFTCNDENGAFEGCAKRIEIENAIELEAVSAVRPPRLAFIDFCGYTRLVRISGRVFPILRHRKYAGNLAHDAVLMEPAVAAEMLNFLRKKGGYQADGGTVHVSDPWFEMGTFTPQHLEAAC